MSDFSHATDNYSHSAVPEKDRVNASHIIAIMVGIAITLPGFLSGAKIMMALGTVQGWLAIFLGGIILSLIATATGYVAVRRRLTTYQILDHPFGPAGSKIISIVMALTLLGWYAVTASLFGRAVGVAVKEMFDIHLAEEFFMASGGILMIVTTIFGLKAISLLARFSVPLMLIVLGAGIYFILDDFTLAEVVLAPGQKTEDISSFGAAVSITVAGFMVGVVIMPDYARYLRKKTQVITSAFLSFALFNTLIMAIAGLPGLMTGQQDFITAMYQTGLGIPALFMMAFATWTSNVGNLYSTSLSVAQLLPNVADWKITAGAGIVGTALALMGVIDVFIPFLIILGITIPPIAGIYITDYFISGKLNVGYLTGPAIKKIPIIPFAVWIFAIMVGGAAEHGYLALTTIPALDSFLTTCIFYPLLLWIYIKRVNLKHARS